MPKVHHLLAERFAGLRPNYNNPDEAILIIESAINGATLITEL